MTKPSKIELTIESNPTLGTVVSVYNGGDCATLIPVPEEVSNEDFLDQVERAMYDALNSFEGVTTTLD